MNFKVIQTALALGVVATAFGLLRKFRKKPLVCSPMMEELGHKIYEDYKKTHNGEEPSREEFARLWGEELDKLKR